MAKFTVGDVFVKPGKVFYPFESERIEELFNRPEVLVEWNFDEFGFEKRGWCLRVDFDYLQNRLKIVREVIAFGKIRVGVEIFCWSIFDPKMIPQNVLNAVRREIERRVELKKM